MPDHFDYLIVALFSAYIMPEERFDHLALEHLRQYKVAGQLKPLKERMLLHAHAYQLTVRGRNYLARLRLAGELGGRPVVDAHDVSQLLDRLAELPKERPSW